MKGRGDGRRYLAVERRKQGLARIMVAMEWKLDFVVLMNSKTNDSEDLRKQVEQHIQEVVDLKKTVSQLKAQESSLKHKLNEAIKEKIERQKEVEELEVIADETEEAVIKFQNENRGMQATMDSMQQALCDLESQKYESEVQVTELQGQLNQLHDENNQTSQLVQNMQQLIDDSIFQDTDKDGLVHKLGWFLQQVHNKLSETEKEIEDLQESQDGLYMQYYDVTQAAINMQDGPTDTSRFLQLGQSLSPIQSHSSAERIAENEQDYVDELIPGGESSLPQTPFKQYNCRCTNQESEGGVGRSLNIVSHCPSDKSSFSLGDESVESAASPTLQHLGRQLFQDEEESSPLIAQHSQFFTPPRHNTFQRSVASEREEREDQTDIFKDDSKNSGDVFGNMGMEQDAFTSCTLFMMPKGGYPQTPFSTPNNQQQENNSHMQNLGLPRTPFSPRG